MIKISVMYPYAPAARFDHAYYRDTHMPLVKRRMGESCRYYSIDQGLVGGTPGTAPTYIGMSHIFCDSVEAFQNGFGPHTAELMADLPHFTDITPVIQISEVLVEHGLGVCRTLVGSSLPAHLLAAERSRLDPMPSQAKP